MQTPTYSLLVFICNQMRTFAVARNKTCGAGLEVLCKNGGFVGSQTVYDARKAAI